MGKRSRKRPGPDRPTSTRAERDARRRAAASVPAGTRRRSGERPPAPWGSFPLSELVVLIGLVLFVVGLVTFNSSRGHLMVFAGMVLGSLGGLEVSVREHFAGFRSHTTLLAGSSGVLAMLAVAVAGKGKGTVVLGIAVFVGTLVFFGAFWLLRDVFRRRSGGLGFR
jgi:hypothetical protein